MNLEALIAAGQALYGDRWQTDLAKALGCSARTVRRWAAGDGEPGPKVPEKVIALIESRQRELEVVKSLFRC